MGPWPLGKAGLLCRVWLTQASSQGQGGQGCHHFANKATEARKVKSLTQNHLARELLGQIVSPDYLLSESTTTEPDLHQQSETDAQGGAEKLRVKGVGNRRTKPTAELPVLSLPRSD